MHRINKNNDLKKINSLFPEWERFYNEDLK